MKYPIGIQSLDQIREEGYVYVDTTALAYDLANKSMGDCFQGVIHRAHQQTGYAKPYATDPRHLIRIGMNFSSQTRTIAEWKCQ